MDISWQNKRYFSKILSAFSLGEICKNSRHKLNIFSKLYYPLHQIFFSKFFYHVSCNLFLRVDFDAICYLLDHYSKTHFLNSPFTPV